MSNDTRRTRREVVGIFSRRSDFDQAVTALLAAGFDRSDLSVLASHDSIDAASPAAQSWRNRLIGLIGELKYEGPLVTAGLIAIAAGPVGATIAGLIAAGVGGVAVKELMDEITAHPHSAEFAEKLAAGDVLLWVFTPDQLSESRVKDVLASHGATNIHTNERPA